MVFVPLYHVKFVSLITDYILVSVSYTCVTSKMGS